MRKKRKNYDYFEAFEKQSALACQESALLIEAIENFTTAQALEPVMERAHELEHAGDMISHDIHTAIARDFIPPIDREDILHVAENMDNILDYIEAVIQRFYMYNITNMHPDALAFAQAIHNSCQALDRAMKDFKNFKKSALKDRIIEVNNYEEEADQLFIHTINKLYANHTDDPMYVMVWTQVFTRMESCADACEHLADVMNSIVIKNA